MAKHWASAVEQFLIKTQDSKEIPLVTSSPSTCLQHQHFLFLSWHCTTAGGGGGKKSMISAGSAVAGVQSSKMKMNSWCFHYAFYLVCFSSSNYMQSLALQNVQSCLNQNHCWNKKRGEEEYREREEWGSREEEGQWKASNRISE